MRTGKLVNPRSPHVPLECMLSTLRLKLSMGVPETMFLEKKENPYL
jgi:hypothetical protein